MPRTNDELLEINNKVAMSYETLMDAAKVVSHVLQEGDETTLTRELRRIRTDVDNVELQVNSLYTNLVRIVNGNTELQELLDPLLNE